MLKQVEDMIRPIGPVVECINIIPIVWFPFEPLVKYKMYPKSTPEEKVAHKKPAAATAARGTLRWCLSPQLQLGTGLSHPTPKDQLGQGPKTSFHGGWGEGGGGIPNKPVLSP